MDVNFPRAPDTVDENILLQQMVECQNGLNTEYNDKLNEIIAKMKSSLQNYLDSNHPGQVVPENGGHYQVMMSVFEDIAVMTLEMDSYHNEELQKYHVASNRATAKFKSYKALDTTHTSIPSDDFDEQLKMLEDKKIILQSARDALDVMAQMRLNCERIHWKLIKKMQKTMDMARAAANGDGDHDHVSGGEGAGAGPGPDPFLGILKKGIYASLMDEDAAAEVGWEQLIRTTAKWTSLKIGEDDLIEWVTEEMRIVDLTLPVARASVNVKRMLEEFQAKEDNTEQTSNNCAVEVEPGPKVIRKKKQRKQRH